MKEKKIFWVDDERKYMLQDDWKRPVTDSSFFLNEKLEWMERNKIDHAVILNLSQLYGNGLRLEMVKDQVFIGLLLNQRVQFQRYLPVFSLRVKKSPMPSPMRMTMSGNRNMM